MTSSSSCSTFRPSAIRVVPNGLEPVFTRGRAAAAAATTCSPSARSSRARTSARASRRRSWRASSCGSWARAGWGGVEVPGWAGRVDDEELAALYRGARCLVFPSLYEGFGLPVIEAMACGTPVVTTRGGATEEVAGGAAVLVDALDADAIAAGIAEAEAPARRARAARARAGAGVHVVALRRPGRGALAGARMSAPLVVVDADVLGRHRTGDETYVLNLLRELPEPAAAAGLRIAAVTRRPDLVPPGIEAIELAHAEPGAADGLVAAAAAAQVGADLVHTQYTLPLRCPCPGVVTIHDLSFERDAAMMGRRDRVVFRRTVPALGPARRPRADRLRALEARPRRALRAARAADRGDAERRRPGVPARRRGRPRLRPRRRRHPAAQEPARRARGGAGGRAAARRRRAGEGCRRSRRELRKRGATLRGYVEIEELASLYRGAACLVQASLYEGFGLPVLEAMASGTPVVTVRDEALLEVVGDAAVLVDERRLADGIRSRSRDRDRLAAAGLERARLFSWRSGRRAHGRRLPGGASTMSVSAVVVSHGHAAELERSLRGARAAGRRDRRDREPARLGRRAAARRPRDRERDARSGSQPTSTPGSPPRSGATSSSRIPTPSPTQGAVAALAAFMDARPALRHRRPADAAGPTGRGSRPAARFPTVAGTIVRRTPLRRLYRPYERQRDHYLLDELPTEPVEADWMLGAFLLQRRSMLDEIGGWDAGYRHYVEDIDLCYRAMRAGWERWYVPAAVVTHAYAAVIDKRFLSRHTLWHLRGMARFARKHPEALIGSARRGHVARGDDGAELARVGFRRVELLRGERRIDRHLDAPGPIGGREDELGTWHEWITPVCSLHEPVRSWAGRCSSSPRPCRREL